MKEQQNVTVVQNIFDAFGRGDIEGILACCSTDCEFYYPGPATIPYAGRKNGHAEIRAYFEAILSSQSSHDLRVEQIVAQDDTVVAIGSYKGVVNSTGKTIEGPLVFTYHLQNGLVKRHMLMSDTAAGAAGYTASLSAAT